MVDLYEVEQRRFAYLSQLKATDPFQYQFLYGDRDPRIVVQVGGNGALSPQGFLAGDPFADPQAAVEEARQKYGGDLDRLKNQNPIPTSETPQPAAAPEEPGAAAGPPPYSGPSAFQKLSSLLPAGFDQTALPASFADPFVDKAFGDKRSGAEEFINRMLARGTATPGGAETAKASLGSQDPGVKAQLRGLADVQLEGERGKLRGLVAPGYTAAQTPGETGENFDPTPYKSAVDTDLTQFQQAFPGSYSKSAGDLGDLYSTTGLQSSASAVTGPQNLQYDPYAVEGGKLKSGLEPDQAEGTPTKKRTTAVF